MKLINWIKSFSLISTVEECGRRKLIFVTNVYGDSINRMNCRSLWSDQYGITYRCSELRLEENLAIHHVHYDTVQIKVDYVIPSDIKKAVYENRISEADSMKLIYNEGLQKIAQRLSDEGLIDFIKVDMAENPWESQFPVTKIRMEVRALKSKDK